MCINAVVDTAIGYLADVLDYVRWRTTVVETLSPEQLARVRRGEEQIARGEHVSLAEVVRLRGE